MKKSDFIKTKGVNPVKKKVASTVLAIAILGSSTMTLFGCDGISNIFTPEGVYTTAQISKVNFNLTEEERNIMLENFTTNFDPRDNTPNENGVISDMRFAEVLTEVEKRADAFAKDYLTKETWLEKYGTDWTVVYSMFYGYNADYRYFPLRKEFNYYFRNYLADIFEPNERISEEMMIKIYSTYEEIYFTKGEEYLKANYVHYNDLTEEELNDFKHLLYSIAEDTFAYYMNLHKDKFKNIDKPFAFSLNQIPAKNYTLIYYNERATIENTVQKIFNDEFWPEDVKYVDELYQKYWVEIGDKVFMERFGFTYSDCLALTEDKELSIFK